LSEHAKAFAEGYRGHPIEMENRAGVPHLKTGQHEAIWTDEEHTVIEVSYAPIDGHSFVVVFVDPDDLSVMAMSRIDMHGINFVDPPDDFELTPAMHQAIQNLRNPVLSL
jgi:hypothetical protein